MHWAGFRIWSEIDRIRIYRSKVIYRGRFSYWCCWWKVLWLIIMLDIQKLCKSTWFDIYPILGAKQTLCLSVSVRYDTSLDTYRFTCLSSCVHPFYGRTNSTGCSGKIVFFTIYCRNANLRLKPEGREKRKIGRKQ